MTQDTTDLDLPTSPEFVLILRDNPENLNELLVAGQHWPAELQATSPAHMIGKFIGENLQMLIAQAQMAARLQRQEQEAVAEGGAAVAGQDSQPVSEVQP